MKALVGDEVIEATAALLARDPDLSNPELLKRLTRVLGREATEQILVTRFQRQVRDPAMRLLRSRMTNGAEPGVREKPSPRAPVERAKEGAGEAKPRGPTPATLERVDRALLQAFELGAAARDRGEIVRAFRELDRLRAETERRLRRAR